MKPLSPPSHRARSTIKIGQITRQIADLSVLKISELWALWDSHFPTRPSHPNRKHLESRIAYRLQEIAFGGIPIATRNLLADCGEQQSKIKTSTKRVTAVLPGSTLLREFDGREYRVTVMPDGRYEFEGQPYKSLSAIAKLITGTQWSGPAFFGLTGKQA